MTGDIEPTKFHKDDFDPYPEYEEAFNQQDDEINWLMTLLATTAVLFIGVLGAAILIAHLVEGFTFT